MKQKLLKLCSLGLLVSLLFYSCEENTNDLSEVGTVTFTVTELFEVENATAALALKVGIDTYNHAGGTVKVKITGAPYGVNYETNFGSAEFDLEVLPQGLASSFTILPINDDLVEQHKVLTIELIEATGSLKLGNQKTMTFTILEDDDPLIAAVSFDAANLQLDEDATSPIEVLINFDQPSTAGGELTISTSGSAIFGADYAIIGQASGNFTLPVAANGTQASFQIQAIDNSLFEPNKTVTFTISGVSGGLTLGNQTTTEVTIVNDELPPNPLLDFDANNTLTYNEDAGTVSLNMVLSSAASSDTTVEITTSGTADANDFNFGGSNANPYTFVIPSGSTTASIDLTIVDDNTVEQDETIILTISSVTGGADIGVNLIEQTITITDNDTASFDYVETFENTNDISALGYEVILVTQDLPDTKVLKYNSGANKYADVDDVNLDSNAGIQLFYNITQGGEGIIDNMAISPPMNASGDITASIDVAYVTGPANGNNAVVTYYWSNTYSGNGSFVASEWTELASDTAADMNSNEGLASGDFKRRTFNFNSASPFYIAVRLNQTMTATNDRTQWRFDNFKVSN